VEEARGFWSRLPAALCDENHPQPSSARPLRANSSPGHPDEGCWNGRDRGSYHLRVVGDGLASQGANPEVQVDVSRQDADINEQIIALRLASKRLEGAASGQSVRWPSSSPDSPQSPSSSSPQDHRGMSVLVNKTETTLSPLLS